ncbi:GntR family transcriptional regulator [Amycolatopsis sp. GM8]|uniref:GntR family transcriptional regulator n=1 Tax=Amycolatopsis sp. GM8 TaxID=2896530 RepID=UPI001F3475E7|nr:GntR family transcriptional regulator [Amycolatopsis sp. GM8]
MAHKYEAVARGIRELIASSLSPHDALPSERELMEIYHVSRMTVRAAIARLIDEGLVYNIHGSGTYVGSRDIFSKSPKLTSFTEDMTSRGFRASSRVLAAYVSEADEELARRLAIPTGSPCTVLRRLRLADEKPIAIEEAYLPTSILDLDRLRLGESLYAQLAEDGHEIIRSEQEIKAIELDDDQCALLEVPDGSAALCVLRVSSSHQGRLIEFACDIYRADRYSFHLAVTRDGNER